MYKKLIYSFIVAVMILVACDPEENRDTLTGAITADNLEISATPQVVDGMNSNNIELNSDGVSCLTSWDYGSGKTTSTKKTVQVVIKGANDIIFTGLNHDGTYITKTLTVQVDTLIDVPEEWGLLCGTGEKTWVWDDTQALASDGSPAVWGNGGYKSNTSPGWWIVGINSMGDQAEGEGDGAEMVFSVKGSSLTKTLTDGTSVTGSFSFDMSNQTLDNAGNVWAKGKLTTKNVTVLAGTIINANVPAYEYDILSLDENSLVLSAPTAADSGEATFWMFKAAD